LKLNLGKKEEPKTDPWLDPKVLAISPLIFPKDMTQQELRERLHGGRKIGNVVSSGIKGYSAWARGQGTPQHQCSRVALKVALARSGFDPKLADSVTEEPKKRVSVD